MGVLSWRGLVVPKFAAPPSGETMRQSPKLLEVQERARFLYHRRRGSQKR